MTYPNTFYIESTNIIGCSTIQSVVASFNELPTGILRPSYNCVSNTGVIEISNATSDARTVSISGELTFQSKVCLPATFKIRRGSRSN